MIPLEDWIKNALSFEAGGRKIAYWTADDGDEDKPSAVLVRPDAEDKSDQRASKNGRADEEPELRLVEAEVLLNLHADDGEDGPHREAHGECDGGHPECAALACDTCYRLVLHELSPPLLSAAEKTSAPTKPRLAKTVLRSIKLLGACRRQFCFR